MKVWLLINDKKDGPHHDFEVRSMINNKDLEPEVLAWHEGMNEWLPIGEIPLFEETFAENEKEEEEDTEDFDPYAQEQPYSPQQEGPPPLPDPNDKKAYLEALDAQNNPNSPRRTYTAEGQPVESLHDGELGVFLWRRLFARLLDITVMSGLTILGIVLFKQQNPLEFLSSQNGAIFIIVLFATYDTVLLHLCGTTLGKALLGIRIESTTGGNLTLFKALVRGVVASLIITAASSILLAVVILILCIVFAKLRERLPWDLYASSVARGLPLTTSRIISTIIVFILINLLVSFFTPKSIMEEQEKYLTEMVEKLKNQ